MFDLFDLFISSQPHILRLLCPCLYLRFLASHILMFVCTCLYPLILTSSYLQLHMLLLASLHPHILKFVCACLYPCILPSLYPQVCACLLVSLHPDILISSDSYLLASILASSYPQVHVCLLVPLHAHILVSTGSCVCLLVPLHAHIVVSSGSFVLACTLAWSHPYIFSSYALVVILASSRPRILRFMCACWYVPQVNLFSIRMNNFILAWSSSLALVNCASQFVNNLFFELLRHEQKNLSQTAIESWSEKKFLLRSRQNL